MRNVLSYPALPHCEITMQAMVDVAWALGFPGTDEYNDACIDDPVMVQARLKNLTFSNQGTDR